MTINPELRLYKKLKRRTAFGGEVKFNAAVSEYILREEDEIEIELDLESHEQNVRNFLSNMELEKH